MIQHPHQGGKELQLCCILRKLIRLCRSHSVEACAACEKKRQDQYSGARLMAATVPWLVDDV